MLRSWGPPGLLLASGLFAASGQRSLWAGAVWLAVLAALAFVLSPLAFPRSVTAQQAQQHSAADGRPVVYWRPGCQYCLRLRLRLGRAARRAHWVNIWSDPAGAAAVRAVAGGNETVPTVVLADGEPAVNPSPDWFRSRLGP
ncbi:glutaredoxin domain-containing protein [Micromonospora sp. NPDC005367]|uniref:glutaredoxin domain-containing protein n=1 Tax=Micromonospora sp. NPDC005367 TaxID=3155590 RepID=UPI0033ACB9AB